MKERKLITKIQFDKMARQVLYDITGYHYGYSEIMIRVIDRAWNFKEPEVKPVSLKVVTPRGREERDRKREK